MSCGSCGTKDGKVSGCGSGGSCSTGGCNRNNVFDWFSFMPHSPFENFNIIEVSFKKGARKGFYRNAANLDLYKGQLVVVEAAQGFDVGEVNLQGELVRAQMRKRGITERDDTIRNVLRLANEEDINVFLDGRNKENDIMVRARAIARSMNLEMKIGDIEFQGDGKKLTVYYIADGRVDFRELVKVYVREFKAKIEMRQIGARQEAGRIGGMGTCGRELCCSTWLQDFKSVTTQTVRYQNLSINTEKMSGQCGRLKCCLNYELDTYNDALKKFPKNADKIETAGGTAFLRKTEILKKLMWYSLESTPGVYFKLDIETVQQLLWMNKQGERPEALGTYTVAEEKVVDESMHEDLVGHVSLSSLEEKDRRHRHGKKSKPQHKQQQSQHKGGQQQKGNQQQKPKTEQQQPKTEQQQNQPSQKQQHGNQQHKNQNKKFKPRNQQNKGPKDKPNE